MKRGCLGNLVFALVLLLAFGGSTYFWFTFFVRGRSLPVPNLIGRTVTEARAICSDLGLKLVVRDERRNSDKVPIDRVVWQNRGAGATNFVKRGTTMRVDLSAGALILRVPDLAGQSQGTSLLRLGQQNLKMGILSYVDTRNAAGVMAEDPPKGTVVPAQSPVSLLVGVPAMPPSYVMPDLIDRPLDKVRPSLEMRGLSVSTVKYETYPGIADGIIIRQYPLRGAPVSSRDPITVVVSRQEEFTMPPQPEGVPAPPPPTTTQ